MISEWFWLRIFSLDDPWAPALFDILVSAGGGGGG